MAGIHGKNASLRISTSETVLSGVFACLLSPTSFIAQVPQGQRDWLYDVDRTFIRSNDASGGAGDEADPDLVSINLNTKNRLINYAAGAVHIKSVPELSQLQSGVFIQAVSMSLTTVASLVGDARNFTVMVGNDTVDSTVIGDSWKQFEDGLTGFEGTIDGLVIDEFWFKRAVSTLSGLLPRTVLRMQIDPKRADSYYQGTVIFPSFEMTGGFDALVEYSVPFQGRGPLDAIVQGLPFFKTDEIA
jgi:hypothetical protein